MIDELLPADVELPDPMADTPLTDKKKVRARAKKSDIKQVQRTDVLKGLLSLREGRAWLYWLLNETCHVWNPSTCVNSRTGAFDPLGTMFNEGARSVGIVLDTQMKFASPSDYESMIRESQEKETPDA